MKLLFERSRAGRVQNLIPACDVPAVSLPTAALSASRSTQPSLFDGTVTALNPAMVHDAGLVPWAASGTMILSRLPCPIDSR